VASLSEFDREQAILVDLDQHGRVEVGELSRRFGVSAVTVRKDLESLERRSMLRRIRV
jgi:DeoR/GlpR family transcriptional regulator of sugar metabolism